MTEGCYLIARAQTRLHESKALTCEECFAVSNCKMYSNFKQLEVTANDYSKLLELMDRPTEPDK
jgi:hypothetical protein